jgi:hypothetical protein
MSFTTNARRRRNPEEFVMKNKSVWLLIVATAVSTFGAGQLAPAQALTMQECSAKYKAAQASGGKVKWNEFRKSECSATAAAAPSAGTGGTTAVTPAPASAGTPKAEPANVKPANVKPATAAIPAPSSAVFPSAVAPKYSTESAGKGRMHTCLDQYNANKSANANGGLKWIEKGGGYYSLCNKRLKS